MRLQYLAFLFSALLASVSAQYELVRAWQGQNFFDGWDYYGGYDNLTQGNVSFVNRTLGESMRLTYVADNGNAILRIDNTTNVRSPMLRNAVYITTEEAFEIGSVFVLSAVHMPYGCSVWPAFFTQGETWPEYGEIDILETINLSPANQMAIHTTPGCWQNGTIVQTGTTTNADCMTSTMQGAGCTVREANNNSVGANFANVGGGVYAGEFANSGINIWFFERGQIPADLHSGNSIDTSTWGTPSANYPSATCNIANFFGPQRMTLDITLCGNYAGGPVYGQTCDLPAGANPWTVCYNNNIAGSGANYDTAYWEIEWVKVFGSPQAAASVSASLASASAASSSASGASETETGSHGTSHIGALLTFDFTMIGWLAPAIFAVLFLITT